MRKIFILLLVLALLFAGCAKRGGGNQMVQTLPAQNQTGTGQNASGSDLGNLFHVDTDKPVEAGGYDVPAAGQNSSN